MAQVLGALLGLRRIWRESASKKATTRGVGIAGASSLTFLTMRCAPPMSWALPVCRRRRSGESAEHPDIHNQAPPALSKQKRFRASLPSDGQEAVWGKGQRASAAAEHRNSSSQLCVSCTWPVQSPAQTCLRRLASVTFVSWFCEHANILASEAKEFGLWCMEHLCQGSHVHRTRRATLVGRPSFPVSQTKASQPDCGAK